MKGSEDARLSHLFQITSLGFEAIGESQDHYKWSKKGMKSLCHLDKRDSIIKADFMYALSKTGITESEGGESTFTLCLFTCYTKLQFDQGRKCSL